MDFLNCVILDMFFFFMYSKNKQPLAWDIIIQSNIFMRGRLIFPENNWFYKGV